MSDKDRELWLEKLVDRYGFSFTKSVSILNEENNLYILECIVRAYDKGKDDALGTYNYSGGR